jgi:hypothetical protein
VKKRCREKVSPVPAIYDGDQLLWWGKPERTTDPGQATGKLYHLRLRVECTLFCDLEINLETQMATKHTNTIIRQLKNIHTNILFRW